MHQTKSEAAPSMHSGISSNVRDECSPETYAVFCLSGLGQPKPQALVVL